MTHITDDSDMLVRTTIPQGTPSNKEEFRFWINDERTPSVTKPAVWTDNMAECLYKVRSVAKNESFYTVRYALFEGEERKGREFTLRVWPAKGTIIAKDSANNSEVNDFKFRMTQQAFMRNKAKSKNIEGGGQNGKYEFDLHAGAVYSIRPRAPWTITEWVKGTADSLSLREVKVREALTAELVGPLGQETDKSPLKIYDAAAQREAAKAKPILKQYVNLTTTRKGWDAKESLVTIEIGAKGDQKKAVGQRKGGAGKFLYFKLNFSGPSGEKSKRSHPKTEPKATLNLASGNLTTVEDGKEYKGKVELASAQKTGKFQVELGYAGGDKCQIKIGGTEECADAALTFINWRKLEYELLVPNTMTNLNRLKTAEPGNDWLDIPQKIKTYVNERLGEVYIEYELVRSKTFTKADIGGDKDSYFTNSKFLKESGAEENRFYIDYFLWDYLAENKATVKYNPQRADRMRVVLAHRAFADSGMVTILKTTITKNSYSFKNSLFSFTNYLFLPKDPGTGKDSLNVSRHKWEFRYKKWSGLRKVWTSDDYPMNDPVPHTLAFDPDVNTSLGSDDDKIFRVEDLTSTKRHEIHFKKGRRSVTSRVSNSEKSGLKQWVLGISNSIADKNDLKTPAKRPKIRITGNTTDNVRLAAVKEAVKSSFRDNLKICNQVGRDWNGKCMKGDINKTWFNFENCEKLTITLPTANPDDPGNMIGSGRGIFIKFRISKCDAINGSAARSSQILTIPGKADNLIPNATAGSKASTVCHELGHRMGITIMAGRSKISKGMPAAEHVDNDGDYYINSKIGPYTNGKRSIHVGPHCAHGVSRINKSMADFGLNSPLVYWGFGDCIMYGSGDPSKDSRKNFCRACRDYIRARKLTSITCNWNGLTEENS